MNYCHSYDTHKTDSIQPFAIDSLHAVPLFNLCQSGENAACIRARDMLVASGLLEYQEPIHDVPENLKSATTGEHATKTYKKISSDNDNLVISPNPAYNFTVVRYKLTVVSVQEQLIVYNASGKVVYQKPLIKALDQLWIDLSGYPSGIYNVALYSANRKIATKNFIVVK